MNNNRHNILFRFMSFREAIKLLKGEQLQNETDFGKNGSQTNSKGFCFMDGDKEQAQYAYENYLSGIVSEDCCVLMQFNHNKDLTESSGRYADPNGAFFDTISVDEVCLEDYDNTVMTPIHYALNVDFGKFEWRNMIADREYIIKVLEQAREDALDKARKRDAEEQKLKEEEERRIRIEYEKFQKFYEYASDESYITDVKYSVGKDMHMLRWTFRFTFFGNRYICAEIVANTFSSIRLEVDKAVYCLAQRRLARVFLVRIYNILHHIIDRIENEYEANKQQNNL